MPPVEIDVITPREVVTEEIVVKQNNLQIVSKALELPLVVDSLAIAKSTISPLVESVEGHVGPIVQSYVSPVASKLEGRVTDLKNKAEAALSPEIASSIKTNVGTVVEQAMIAADSLDKLACGGLDTLTEKVPLLKESSSDVIDNTKETVASYLEFFTEYTASFTVAQIALKLSDAGLSLVSSVLDKNGLDTKTVNKVRRGARAVRRAGARRAGPLKPAATIGEVSFIGAVAEILGLNFFLSFMGLQLSPCNKKLRKKTKKACCVETEKSVRERLISLPICCAETEKSVRERLNYLPACCAETEKSVRELLNSLPTCCLETEKPVQDSLPKCCVESEKSVKELLSSLPECCVETGKSVREQLNSLPACCVETEKSVREQFNSLPACCVETEKSVREQPNSFENVEDYKSDEDSDYAPSETSEDSMEYESDSDKAIVYEDEHAKVIAEPDTEQEPTVVDTEIGEVEPEAGEEPVDEDSEESSAVVES